MVEQTREGAVFHVFGVDIHCRVSEDGHRVMDSQSVEDLVAAIAGDAEPGEIDALAEWQRSATGAPSEPPPAGARQEDDPWLKRLVGRLQNVPGVKPSEEPSE